MIRKQGIDSKETVDLSLSVQSPAANVPPAENCGLTSLAALQTEASFSINLQKHIRHSKKFHHFLSV